MHMTGVHEPGESLNSPAMTMFSSFISPCPKRHFSPTWASKENNYRTSINPRGGEGSITHITVRLEGCNVPLNEVRDFLDQLGLRHSV